MRIPTSCCTERLIAYFDPSEMGWIIHACGETAGKIHRDISQNPPPLPRSCPSGSREKASSHKEIPKAANRLRANTHTARPHAERVLPVRHRRALPKLSVIP